MKEFAKNLIETNIHDFLIYENKESLFLMLKQAFYKGEIPNTKNSIATPEKVKEILEIPGVFENVFVPAFQRDQMKAMKVCSFPLVFIGVEDFLKAHRDKLIPLLNSKDEVNEDGIEDFMVLVKILEKKEMSNIQNFNKIIQTPSSSSYSSWTHP